MTSDETANDWAAAQVARVRDDPSGRMRSDRETLRRRAGCSPNAPKPSAHAGPIDEDRLVYRIEFHAVR
jgi:hypothetical protein